MIKVLRTKSKQINWIVFTDILQYELLPYFGVSNSQQKFVKFYSKHSVYEYDMTKNFNNALIIKRAFY